VSKLARSENQFSADVLDFFASKLVASDFYGVVEVSARQQVLTNLTVVGESRSGKWTYNFGLQQQDIVFHLRGDAGSIQMLSGPLARYRQLGEEDSQSHPIRLPLLSCELSLRRHATAHQLITYSRAIAQIREIHPHCGFFLVVGGAGARTFRPDSELRQAKGFDRVFLDWETESEAVWQDVVRHLSYLRLRAEVVGGNDAA
jgi:hypothetical protein